MTTKSVHYAEPQSPNSDKLGCYVAGGFYVRLDDDAKGVTLSEPFPTLAAAEAYGAAQPGEWSRKYLACPLYGSTVSTVSTVAQWAPTHAERVKQWRASCERHARRKTLAALRKGWAGSTAPRYVAEFSDGTTIRVSFWQAKSKPYDFARGRKVAIGTSGRTIVRGHVEHEIPGQAPVRVEDPMQARTVKAPKVSYKALLERLLAAVHNDNVDELKAAYQEATAAVA